MATATAPGETIDELAHNGAVASVLHCHVLMAAAEHADGSKRDTTWLKEAKYGVFAHHLGGSEHWKDRVNAFDAKEFTMPIPHRTLPGSRSVCYTGCWQRTPLA